MVKAPTIPNEELADNWSEVPFNTTLNRFGAPLSVDIPVKVAVPAEAVKLPLTAKPLEIEKFTAVLILPGIESVEKLLAPDPEMVLETPLMVNVDAFEVKLPVPERKPVRVSEKLVLTEPLTVRFSIEIPLPEMVLAEPVIVTVPPEAWLNEPEPVVARFPLREMLAFEKVISGAAMVRLL